MEKLTMVQADLIGNAFEEHGSLVLQVARKFAGANAELGDLQSYLNEKFMEAVLRFDATKGSMGAYINVRLRQHALNYINSGYNQYRTETTPFSKMAKGSDEIEGDIESFELLKDERVNIADQVVKNDEVSTTINALLENATDLQRKIMDVYIKAEVKPTFTQVGKAVGVHHETVKRELAKLAKITTFDVSLLA